MKENFNILVVDDDFPLADSLADILKDEGYNAIPLESGVLALETIKTMDVHLVIMDIKMPVLNGVETYKRMKKMKTPIPVIMMTAYTTDELINEAIKEGVYAALNKPLNLENLIAMVALIKKGNR